MQEIMARLRQIKIVPVIAIEKARDIIPLGHALADNGLPVAEITFRTESAAEAISLLKAERPDMLIGAGTVLQREHVRQAKAAGAEFVVSPGFNPNTVLACQQIGIPIIPGVNNASTIEQALESGINFVKFFPAEPSGGIAMIKALLAPYPQLQVMPTGGINVKNIRDYLAIPQIVACGGSWMVSPQLIRDKDWKAVGRLVREAVELVNAC
ncbi:bifunctional 4-hydroxy-2-oxoglutarate aldolase/2-dehydro-3-deoxy-phosphogluconate aldolase [Xenorhabdus griffiniae]|uniref:2-dehydro-3-deoxy-phosphogluconate aldolase n=1 Tax=Xenorhabdus griffiniae TaxID=351672 RepID=A0ABY9XGJ8_9GAMM|nr:bifunctional 4-hydroxy-2-oxoglutarate aldolase/2-dehydro-3-deoxy-phosphogluconate aldolase [Xenorhabdus griffiniae]MBD1228508.1 bifunctional 4-hydroxy-2-oxoglutarate aldolase/2-dehydro-3-deoxy-phosphogluconate aldolase [Xenorhabdus griffiniae]MBE8588052.1 bifunctional 4-hydroxy-2-oxoglutarate aldolase/2-dehydro-3-deoxy-phosphogluconate aldolase [Xenorhabdus griffiniae]WMV72061.1 bifunctional 4-hydroxy-2-oxoglutarate aldolase/2-dehydro-3-deoxy-phosphogluconate aldolase [Xenorhabdus griffiniae]